ITVSTAGTYTVTATNSCGSAQATQTINTTTGPVANINSAATSFCAGSNLVLHATGSGSYSWTSGSTNDSLVVTSGGTYIVTSTTTCGTASDTITITQNPLPVALITPAGSTTICAGNSVVLNGSGGTSYVWLPTGASTNSISAATAGTYTLTAINACGVDTATSTVTIINAPVATITPASATTICAGSSVMLNASGGGTYTWSTGQTGNSISASNSGTYIVTATNTCGSSSVSITVTVDSVTALFTASPTSGVYPLPVNFSNNSSASAIAYAWDFGDNATSAVTTPNHTYQTPGAYMVMLTAVNANGCTDTYMLTITVLENPSILQIPNVFTPNNDGENDLFKVTSEGIVEFSCAVFDRWGIKMAELSAVNQGWDGRTSAGEPASDGTYYYVLKAKGAEGKEYDEKGFIQLIRK
ncbi:MAG: domain containing protein, partial [Bacteroidetes bacterium]|nr:domain containing protein [Bacteroidota bacterium]